MMRMNRSRPPHHVGWLHRDEIASIRASVHEHAQRRGMRAQDADELLERILAQFNVSPDGREIPYRQHPHPHASRHPRRFHRGPHR